MRRSDRGFTLIELMIVIAIIAIIAAIALPNLIEARKGANETAAIGALRTIGTAQHLFREADRDKDNVEDYASSLAELGNAGALVDAVLAAGTKQGYVFQIVQGDRYSWSATANPAAPGKSGDRYFFVDESGALRYNTSSVATSTSTAVGG
jgi:type IV pilus assembly protein PilA